MQRSFSILDMDEELSSGEERYPISSRTRKNTPNYQMQSIHGTLENDEEQPPPPPPPPSKRLEKPPRRKILSSNSTPGQSGQYINKRYKNILNMSDEEDNDLIDGNNDNNDDIDDEDDEIFSSGDKSITIKQTKAELKEYDPGMYDDLDVDDEIQGIFQYISSYVPQSVQLEYKFKAFIPEFIPAVGDIDAFLKVVPPERLFNGESFTGHRSLGLAILDEPATHQSDAALLHLHLRAKSVKAHHANDTTHVAVVKRVDDLERDSRVIDRWIKDITELHRSKPSPTVRYTEPVPDLDDLLQQWPEEMEERLRISSGDLLKQSPLKNNNQKQVLHEYVDNLLAMFGIKLNNRMHAVHLFFCLYAAVKSSQLFKSTNSKMDPITGSGGSNKPDEVQETEIDSFQPDQLVLE